MLMLSHVDPRPAKPDTLHFQPYALVGGRLPFEPDLSAGAQDALPRQRPARLSQNLDHLPMM